MKYGVVSLLMFLAMVLGTVSAQISVGPEDNLLAVGNYNVNQTSGDLGSVVQLEANGTIVVDEGDPVRFFFNQSDNNLAGVTDTSFSVRHIRAFGIVS